MKRKRQVRIRESAQNIYEATRYLRSEDLMLLAVANGSCVGDYPERRSSKRILASTVSPPPNVLTALPDADHGLPGRPNLAPTHLAHIRRQLSFVIRI